MITSYSKRKYVITIIFLVIGALFIIRLFYLQVLDQSYTLSANKNVLRHVTQYPARGLVYDRTGKLLVYNDATYDLMVVPKQVKNIDTSDLCSLIGITKEEFNQRLEKAKIFSPYLPTIFEHQISKENYGYIQEKLYKFRGFYVQARTLRKYPIPIAAHTLGYIGEVGPEITENNSYYKMGDYIGISGIEKSYELQLRGYKGLKIMMVDVFNREKGSFQNGKYDVTPIAGQNLYTSLDADIQAYGEYLMQNKKGSVVAIDPSTGEILALVTSPSYDPNLLVGRVRSENYNKLAQDPEKPLFNRALMAQYPPGSTFKLVHALIGLQEGVLTPETRYPCHAGYRVGNIHVACHNHMSPLNLKQSIQHSCNAYYCAVFRSIVENRNYNSVEDAYNAWRGYATSFGFGNSFDDDLTNALKGLIPKSTYYDRYYGRNHWKGLTIISLGIGQGEIGITPLQLANFAAIMANRGYYYTPHIMRALGDKNNENMKYAERKTIPIDTKYFEIVVDAMEEVVNAGTATIAKIDSIAVCGKTGTAQNPHGKDHSIFIAFAPKVNPKIAIAVIVENAGFGATTAAPIASLLIEKYLKHDVSKRKWLEDRIVNLNLMSK